MYRKNAERRKNDRETDERGRASEDGAAEEDEEYAEMMYYYLIECGTDRGEGLSDEEFRQLMRKQYDEVMDGVY